MLIVLPIDLWNTYENGGFVVKASTFVVDFMSNINGEDVEVLGNIVDNPELLG